MADALGWIVRRIKIDVDCYEIDGRDAQGHPIEVTIHPETFPIIEFENGDEEESTHHTEA